MARSVPVVWAIGQGSAVVAQGAKKIGAGGAPVPKEANRWPVRSLRALIGGIERSRKQSGHTK
jgi:hypothetical protein